MKLLRLYARTTSGKPPSRAVADPSISNDSSNFLRPPSSTITTTVQFHKAKP